jgi:DNA repair protein RecN (Recombination protein N)
VIVELTVENIALIERAQLNLGPGFTALTGETGAGKSLFVDAVELALGARADTDLVRSGANRASVSLTFDLSSHRKIEEQLVELGASIEDHTVYIQRELFAEGRSQCRIGGRLAPLSQLKAIGSLLVDLHGQHEHQSLLRPESHIEFLDAWIGIEAIGLKEEIKTTLSQYQAISRKLTNLRQGQREREQRIDLLTFQSGEIRNFEPAIGEYEELQGLEARLRHSDQISQSVNFALESIVDSESCALDTINAAMRGLEDAARLDVSLDVMLEPIRNQVIGLQESMRDLRSYGDSVEADPQRHEEVLERIEGYRKLFRKYGDDEHALLSEFEKIELELSELVGDVEGEDELAAQESQIAKQLADQCNELTELRKRNAVQFCEQVAGRLDGLAMERAKFDVSFQPKPAAEDGADLVEFLFSANAGEPVKPLAKIASGGEISRVMLAIKSVLANNAGVPTLIFDEVDVGLGGRAAAMVAKLLEDLATYSQVLVISHLPQIASRATTHYSIRKESVGERVLTKIQALDDESRVDELARMIAGETITDAASTHARELLNWR